MAFGRAFLRLARSARGRVALGAVGGGAAAAAAAAGCGQAALCESSKRCPFAPFIDHTVLKPDARDADIVLLCREAREHQFSSVCVNPIYVSRAKELLEGSRVKVCAVVGFPLGASTTVAKVVEAVTAIHDGADEIDMVLPVGKLKDRDARYVQRDIRAVVDACHERGVLVKVILETCLLDERDVIAAVVCAGMAGADFVKTSTGFSRGGATVADVALMHRIGEPLGLQVKASGGVSTAADAQAMLRAGASRIGASKGVQICAEAAGHAAAAAAVAPKTPASASEGAY